VDLTAVPFLGAIGSIEFVQSLAVAQLGSEVVEKAVKGYLVALEPLKRARLSLSRNGDVYVVEREAVEALKVSDPLQRRAGDDLRSRTSKGRLARHDCRQKLTPPMSKRTIFIVI
jgi:hypothetical protein